jgi:hypothetical protein
MAEALHADLNTRRVTLKPLPADCLLHGELHPTVKERLERIRQIPHPGVAALLGVERDQSGRAWLAWELIEGESFVDATCDPRRSPREVATLMRELVLSVESFHAAGLVHGELNDGAIVAPDGKIWLTNVSPLLFHDPAVDERAVFEMLRNAIERRGESNGLPSQLIARDTSLRGLRTGLAAVVESPDIMPAAPIEPRADSRVRRGALIWATVVALLGTASAIGIYRHVRSGLVKPMAPPVLQESR